MAYMVSQRFATAVRDAYGDGRSADELRAHLEAAGRTRAWLASLDIDPAVRAWLIEPIAAVEDAFAGVLRAAERRDP